MVFLQKNHRDYALCRARRYPGVLLQGLLLIGSEANALFDDNKVFTIENDRPQTNLSVQLRVYDISGRQVYETSQTNFTSSSSYTFTWDTNGTDSHLVPGIYIVKAAISTSDGPQATKATKFIVTRHK